MSQPLIGVTTYRVSPPSGASAHAATETYVRSLLGAGAIPLLVPLDLPEDALDALLPRLDGLLFTGGGDVHPRQYGSAMHPAVNSVDEDRDRIELHLVRAVAGSGKPFMGICRGLQIINIGLGGSLYEDILDQHSGAMHHAWFDPSPRDHLAHTVTVQVGSRLAQLLQANETPVNSIHHQGIRTPAPGLRASAHAPDGLVEAVELPGHPFGLAVQWHPECLPDDPAMRRLFQGFVQAAGQ